MERHFLAPAWPLRAPRPWQDGEMATETGWTQEQVDLVWTRIHETARARSSRAKSVRTPGWRYPLSFLSLGFVLMRVNGAAGLALGGACLLLALTPLLWSRTLLHELRAHGGRLASPGVTARLICSSALWLTLVAYMQAIRRA